MWCVHSTCACGDMGAVHNKFNHRFQDNSSARSASNVSPQPGYVRGHAPHYCLHHVCLLSQYYAQFSLATNCCQQGFHMTFVSFRLTFFVIPFWYFTTPNVLNPHRLIDTVHLQYLHLYVFRLVLSFLVNFTPTHFQPTIALNIVQYFLLGVSFTLCFMSHAVCFFIGPVVFKKFSA